MDWFLEIETIRFYWTHMHIIVECKHIESDIANIENPKYVFPSLAFR